jgi:hypothetical protein
MGWQKIGSLGIGGDLEVIRTSGCHTGPEGEPNASGHGWIPYLDDVAGVDVERLGHYFDRFYDQSLDRSLWSFHPKCKDCVRETRRLLRDERGLTVEEIDRAFGVLGIRRRTAAGRDLTGKTDLFGWRADGSYGLLHGWHVASAVQDNPDAAREIHRTPPPSQIGKDAGPLGHQS